MSSTSAIEFSSRSQNNDKNDQKLEHVHQLSENNRPSCSLQLSILTFLAAIGGFLFGYDTGVISSAAIFLRRQYSLTDFQVELIVSATVGAAALFSTIAGYINNLLGRKTTILISSFLFIIGSTILALSFSFWTLIFGRLIVGIAVGVSSTTIPTYLAEISPTHSRGTMLASFQLMITFGMWMASMIGAGLSYLADDVGWRWMLGFAAFPAALQLLGFLFMPESPRWLVYRGREMQAFNVLVKISSKGFIENDRGAYCTAADELTNILKMKNKENEIIRSSKLLKRKKCTKYFNYALLLGCSLQLFQQMSGINTVMYYSATIIQMSGVLDDSLSIWLSSITAGVNFLATFSGMYLISKISRRILLLSSISGVIFTLLLLSLSFFFIERESDQDTMIRKYEHFNNDDVCSNHSSCVSCTYDASCGFCARGINESFIIGQCISVSENKSRYCSDSGNSSNLNFYRNFCPSNLAWLSITSLALYLCSFAVGFGPLPWTICAEIFDNKSRSLGTSVTTTVNWTANLLVSLTFLTLTQAISRQGAFLLYAGLSTIGLVLLYIFLPETKYHTLDDVEFLMKRNSHTYSTFM